MGFKTEFNWILKLKPEQGLNEHKLVDGQTYSFSKEEYRVYPMGIPIDLINSNWEALAKVEIVSSTTASGKTLGQYKVLRLFSPEEKELATKYWRNNLEIMKGEKIIDFSKVKVS